MASPSLHAVLGASSAHRWLECPPSARLHERMTSRFGKSESVHAKEGTKAHALGELKIRNAFWHEDGMTTERYSKMTPAEQEAYTGINDFRYQALRDDLGEIPSDMEKATDTYCDVVMHRYLTAKEADPNTLLLLEQRYDYSEWVPSGFGTGDATIVSDNLLEVLDYKHGKGVPVDAVGNPQIRLYELGAYMKFRHLFDFDKVRGVIIQPRLESLTEEDMTVSGLLDWAVDFVQPRAKLAWAGQGDFCPGDHCRWCAAKAVCSARVSEALKMFKYGFESPGTIPDEQIPDILPVLDVAEDWIKDIRAYAESQALSGHRWKGYKLVRGKKPNRKWGDPEEVKAQLLRAGYSPTQFETTALKPPGEVEKTLGKTAFRALLSELVSQGEGKLTLVPESDKRVEYASADADFGDLLGGEDK